MDVFDLYASIKLNSDEYDKGLEDAEKKTSGLGNKIGNALSVAGKIGGAAIAAATGAVINLASQSVSAFASFEQLEGGVKTLFGAQELSLQEYADRLGVSADQAKEKYDGLIAAENEAFKNAANAYKTAGMNMNDYMSTITSFAAALKSSTSSELEAAKVADVAIQDMSDNANKMGTSMESIQNAYQGFAKQNYTMLDNLKLGYGGTKTEMERLLADAQKLTGVKYDISNLADVYNAIHAIQENLGITGTTAREAMKTIEGSANMTRAAWDNVIIAIGRGEGIKEAFDNLLTAIMGDGSEGTGLLANIIPRIKTVMEGIGNFITQASPLLAEAIPKLIDAIFPSLLESAISLVGMLAKNLPGILASLGNSIITAVKSILSQVMQYIVGYDMFSDVSSFADGILDIFATKIPDFYKTAVKWLEGIISGISSGAGKILENAEVILEFMASGLKDGIPRMILTGHNFIANFINGFLRGLPNAIKAVSSLIGAVVTKLDDLLPYILSSGLGLIKQIIGQISKHLPDIVSAVETVITNVINYLVDSSKEFFEHGGSIISNFIKGISEKIPDIIETAAGLVSFLITAITDAVPILLENGALMLESILEGFTSNEDSIIENVWVVIESLLNALADGALSLLDTGIAFISNIIDGILEELPTLIETFGALLNDVISFIMERLPDFLEKGADLIINILNGIGEHSGEILSSIGSILGDAITTIMDKLPDFLEKGIEIVGRIAQGIIDNLPELISSAAGALADLLAEIGEHFPDFIDKGFELLGKVATGIINAVPDLLAQIPGILEDVANKFLDHDWLSIGMNIINGIADGVTGYAKNLADAAISAVGDAWDGICNWLGIASPSKKARDIIGKNWALGIGVGFEDNIPEDDMISGVESTMKNMRNALDPFDVPITTTVSGSDRNGSRDNMSNLYELLAQYLPQISANKDIYFNDGVWAGRLAPTINEELGRIAQWEAAQ